MTGLYLVADDLTGALDSAAPFCAALGPLPVWLGAAHPEGAPDAAVDLDTRDGDAVAAEAAARRVLAGLRAAALPFRKIDSRLRGHWARELAVALREGTLGPCVLAPAFPHQGRATRAGRVWLRDEAGAWTAEAFDPADTLRALGLRVAHASRGAAADGARALATHDVVLFDADDDADLDAVVAAVRAEHATMAPLWCGAGGLARALARGQAVAISAPLAPPPAGPTLCIVGTDHAVTQAQVAFALTRGAACRVVGDEDAEAPAAIARALARAAACVLTFELPEACSADAAARAIERRLHALLPRLPRPGALVVSGGRTLLATCRALGAHHLLLDGELSPGVARARLAGGAWDDVEVVAKSGGFGASAWLARHLGIA